MKAIILVLLSLFFSLYSYTQIDSFKKIIAISKNDTNKVKVHYHLSNELLYLNNSGEAIRYAKLGLLLASKLKFENGIIATQLLISRAYRKIPNYPAAIDALLEALKMAEQAKNRKGILLCYDELYNLNQSFENYQDAIDYTIKMKNEFYDVIKDSVTFNFSLLGDEDYRPMNFFLISRLGIMYKQMNKLDSALKYSRMAYEYGIANFGEHAQYDYATPYLLGSVESKLNNNSIALPYLKKSVAIAERAEDFFMLPLIYSDLAKIYKDTNERDSSFYYANKGYIAAQRSGMRKTVMDLGFMLASLYSNVDNTKAVVYFAQSNALRDSIFSQEKSQLVQKRIYEEKMRQKEMQIQKEKEEEERILYIQYAAIAIGIIVLLTIFILLSYSFIANEIVIKILGVSALLITFEFINLIIHPYIAEITHHSPVLMLLTLVAIAAILVPFHHKIEKWAIKKMVEKNKKIRLMAAKKTIEKLEEKPEG